jgi:hypothetical protein
MLLGECGDAFFATNGMHPCTPPPLQASEAQQRELAALDSALAALQAEAAASQEGLQRELEETRRQLQGKVGTAGPGLPRLPLPSSAEFQASTSRLAQSTCPAPPPARCACLAACQPAGGAGGAAGGCRGGRGGAARAASRVSGEEQPPVGSGKRAGLQVAAAVSALLPRCKYPSTSLLPCHPSPCLPPPCCRWWR